MAKLPNKLTQRERILKLLRERGEDGVKVWELIAPRPRGEGIAQYNSRIHELREGGHDIVNVEPGNFVLKEFKEEPMIDEKITDLGNQLAFV